MEEIITSDNSLLSLPIHKQVEETEKSATDCTANSALQSIAETTVCGHGVIGVLQSVAEAEAADRRATAYVSASLSENTKRAYSGDLSHFLAWGGARK